MFFLTKTKLMVDPMVDVAQFSLPSTGTVYANLSREHDYDRSIV